MQLKYQNDWNVNTIGQIDGNEWVAYLPRQKIAKKHLNNID